MRERDREPLWVQELDDDPPSLDEVAPEPYLCSECGESGGCAVDAEGRILIHVIEDPDGGVMIHVVEGE